MQHETKTHRIRTDATILLQRFTAPWTDKHKYLHAVKWAQCNTTQSREL